MLIRALERGGMQHAHFEGLGRERYAELLARMAFLVTRGLLPANAYHVANDGMVHDELEHDSDSELGIEWDVVKSVADAWPDPARGPDARPVAGVFFLARHIVGLVEATIECPETEDGNRSQLDGMCASERMRRKVGELFDAELARRRPQPPPGEGDGDGGDGGEGGGPAGSRDPLPDDDRFPELGEHYD